MTEREMDELAIVLSADAPRPDPEFVKWMDGRLAAGFPREEEARSVPAHVGTWLRWLVPSRIGSPTVGALAAALLALAIGIGGAVSALRSDEATSPSTTVSSPETTVAPAVEPDMNTSVEGLADDGAAFSKRDSQHAESPESGLRDDTVIVDPPIARPAPLPSPKRGEALAETDRRVERSAFITLAAPADELSDAGSRIVEVAQRNEGFVLNSSLTTGEDGTRGGQFELRVPVDRLDATLAQLAEVGEVRALTQDDRDVTAGFEVIEDRLKEAEADRRGLLRRLEAASTEAEAASIRRQLRDVNRSIAGIRDNERRAENRIAFASVSVTLEKGRADATPAIAQALEDALSILTSAVGLALRGLAVLAPLGIVALIAWLAVRAVRRRRREAALD